MSKKASIAQNFLFNALLTASQFIFPLITYPYVARVLLPEGSGKVAFATSLISYFVMFAELGVPKYGIRKCAVVRDDKEALSRTVHELIAIRLATTVIAAAVYVVCIFMVPKLRAEKALYFVVGMTLPLHLVGMEWMYQGLEEYRYISIRSLCMKVVSVCAMFLFVHKKEDYVIYAGISVLASSASCIFNLIRARKYIYFRWLGKYNLSQHLKPIFVFFAMACAVSIYSHIDTIMLGFISGDAEVGYYNAAVKLKSMLVSLTISLSVVLLPRASYYLTRGQKEKFIKIAKKSINFSALFATPCMVFCILFSDLAITFLAGESYKAAILPMRLIMPTLFLIGMSYPSGIQILVPLGKETVVLWSEIAGVIVNVIGNSLLIPRTGSAGAAVSTVLAEGAVLVVQYLSIRKIIPDLFADITAWKIIAGMVAGIGASCWVCMLNLNAFLSLCICGCCFFFAYGVVLILLKETMVSEILNTVKTKIFGKIKGK